MFPHPLAHTRARFDEGTITREIGRAMLSSSARPLPVAAKGWCACCEREHTLARTPEAEHHALALLAAIEERRRFDVDATEGDPRFSLDVCGASQGKMLGVLTCEGGKVLKAFSGTLGEPRGTWLCPGWCGPVAQLTLEAEVASRRFETIVEHVALSRAAVDEASRAEHRRTHRALSAALSADLAASVVLRNWAGREAALPEILAEQQALFQQQQQPPRRRRRGGGSRALTRSPWGVGDCAAPKLLHAARELGLRPTGLAEVWHEALSLRPSRCAASDEMPRSAAAAAASGLARTRRKHGSFHAACAERCEPIMGFMLCGAEADPDGGPGQR